MTKTWGVFFSVLLYGVLSFAIILPAENDLPALMLNQNDSLFFERGVAPGKSDSSLCGPTSAVNWLQLKSFQQPYSKEHLVELVREVGADLSAKNIDINQGLVEPDLVTFLKTLNRKLGIKQDYAIKGRYGSGVTIQEEDIWSPAVQILMLNFREIPRPLEPGLRPGRPGRNIPLPDDLMDRPLVRGNHFVLKVFADRDNKLLGVIDPENPSRFSLVRVNFVTSLTDTTPVIQLKPATRQDLSAFTFGVPLSWSLISIIEEK
ncbi:hypothetical protein [Bdellovibrio sp. BCCA]|uniref:hypothetical protein n=1 Tax=Bdellovibrio sp. BCCA TaxID=3136281 RepID=UPI0030EFB145